MSDTLPDERGFVKLARYICAAWIANQMGIGLDYALKTYVSDPPGNLWMSVAGELVEHFRQVGIGIENEIMQAEKEKRADKIARDSKNPEGPQVKETADGETVN